MSSKNNYIKATCVVTPCNPDFSDLLSVYLSEQGFESFVTTEAGLEAYVLDRLFTPEVKTKVETCDYEYFQVQFSYEEIVSKNWNEEWEKNYFEPLHVGNECIIRAPFHPAFPDCKYEIVIEPKMAFGTGNHETTYLMMEQILELNLAGKTVLDMGCGTGVLAILASMMGASEVLAVDYDIWSYESAIENATKNHITNMQARHGDASCLDATRFDIIFANIHRNVLLNDIKHYVQVLQPEGILMMSGFYSHDLADIKSEALKNGLTFQMNQVKKDWNMALFTF